MRAGSKKSVTVCTGIVALSLAVASVAGAETTVSKALKVETVSPITENSLQQESSVRTETTSEKAPVAGASEGAPRVADPVQGRDLSTQAGSTGSGSWEMRTTGPGVSSQVRVATSQGHSEQTVQTTRTDGNLAVRVQSTSGGAPATVSTTIPATSATVNEEQDTARLGTVTRQTQRIQTGQAVSTKESDTAGDTAAAEPREAGVQTAVRRHSAPVRSEPRLITNPRKVESKIQKLRVREQRDLIKLKPATATATATPSSAAANPADRSQELRVAREDITARPLPRISSKQYEKLYREAAEDNGFADDWYILAAVGKVESDHGRNLGPSSAGAMGPMQFLPSTWEAYGMDGNGDGVANIMDPEDAIPAAASYLKAGGAPEDWYAALYTYNRAGWYVKKVLRVAEAYRQLAEDTTVGPYS